MNLLHLALPPFWLRQIYSKEMAHRCSAKTQSQHGNGNGSCYNEEGMATHPYCPASLAVLSYPLKSSSALSSDAESSLSGEPWEYRKWFVVHIPLSPLLDDHSIAFETAPSTVRFGCNVADMAIASHLIRSQRSQISLIATACNRTFEPKTEIFVWD